MIKRYILFLLFPLLLLSKTITISYDPDYPPYCYKEDNKAKGLLVDIYKEWAKYAHVKVKFVDGKNWVGAINLLKNKKVDFFIGTSPYEDWMIPGYKIFEGKGVFFKLKNRKKKFSRIGIVGDDYYDILKEKYPKSKIISVSGGNEYSKLVRLLREDKIDVIFEDKLGFMFYLLKNNIDDIVSLNDFIYKDNIHPISYSKEKVKFFNKYFEKIPVSNLRKIENKWVKFDEDKFYKYILNIHFTKKEKEYIKNHIFTFALMKYWDDDTHSKIIDLIKKYGKIRVKKIYFNSWKEGFNKVKNGEIDAILNLSHSKEREKYFFYTKFYKSYPVYVIKSKHSSKIDTVLVKSKTITYKIAQKYYPNKIIKEYPTLKDLYNNVNNHSLLLTYFLNYKLLDKNNLIVSNIIYDSYSNVYIGVSKKHPLSFEIINKIFNAIPLDEINKAVVNLNNIKTRKADKSSYFLVIIFLIFSVISMLVFIYMLTKVEVLSNTSFKKLLILVFISEIVYVVLFLSLSIKQSELYQIALNKQMEKLKILKAISDVNIDNNLLSKLNLVEKKLLFFAISNSNTMYIIDNLKRIVSKRYDYQIKEIKKNLLLFKYTIFFGTLVFVIFNIILFLVFRKKLLDPLEFLKRIIFEFYYNKNVNSAKKVYFKDEIGEIIESFINISKEVIKKEKTIEEYNKRIKHSLEYALTIQKSILGDEIILLKNFKDYMIIWKPKDIVGGDVYFIEEIDNKVIIMAFDCTGHGVYGAFITMLVSVFKDDILYNKKILNSDVILSEFNRIIKIKMNQLDKTSKSNIGFDGGVVIYDKSRGVFEFSGAKSSLFIVNESNVEEIKGNRKSIGDKRNKLNETFKKYEFTLKDENKLFISSDGLFDQFDKNGKIFSKQKFLDLILENNYKNMNELKEIILSEFNKFIQDNERVDDIMVIGIKK